VPVRICSGGQEAAGREGIPFLGDRPGWEAAKPGVAVPELPVIYSRLPIRSLLQRRSGWSTKGRGFEVCNILQFDPAVTAAQRLTDQTRVNRLSEGLTRRAGSVWGGGVGEAEGRSGVCLFALFDGAFASAPVSGVGLSGRSAWLSGRSAEVVGAGGGLFHCPVLIMHHVVAPGA